jgi:hypothetical protein
MPKHSPLVDEICPAYVGEDRIKVSFAPNQSPRAFAPVSVLIDYSECDADGGVVFPVEIVIIAPSPGNCEVERIDKGTLPTERSFTPREGGPHMFLVREVFGSNWWGRLRVPVAGERLRVNSQL